MSDDSMILTGGQDGMLRAWSWNSDLLAEIKTHVLSLNDAALVDCTIATGGSDYKVRLWDGNFPGCQVAPMIDAPSMDVYEPPFVPEVVPDPPADLKG